MMKGSKKKESNRGYILTWKQLSYLFQILSGTSKNKAQHLLEQMFIQPGFCQRCS